MQAIIAIILSIYVLFGSIGMPLYKHSCLVGEKINYSFHSKDNYCSDFQENSKATISNLDCCEFSSTYFQVKYDAFSLTRDFSIEVPVSLLPFTFKIPAAEILNISIYSERGPPIFYGRTLLAFIQCFLI